MNGDLPEIYWYLFWIGVLAFAIVFSVAMTTIIHRRNMKALAALELYAQAGVDPPPTLAGLLARPSPHGPGPRTAESRR